MLLINTTDISAMRCKPDQLLIGQWDLLIGAQAKLSNSPLAYFASVAEPPRWT